MSTLGTNSMTVRDVVRRSKPDGTLADITELLNQRNGMADDAPWVQADLPRGTYSTQRTSLPTWATVNPNGSVTLSKSTTAQNLEPIEILATMLEIERNVGNYGTSSPASKMASEAVAGVEGGKQTVASRLISGNGSTTVGQVNGFQTRYSLSTAPNGRNVILGGALAGQTDCMSAYLIRWGERNAYCFYPQGTTAGIVMTPYPDRVSEPSSTTRKIVSSEYLEWAFGLAVPNWTSVARVCNIDKSLLVAGTGADLFDKLTFAWHATRRAGDGRDALYMNTTTRMMLDVQARNAAAAGGAGGMLGWIIVEGKQIDTFRGIPINYEDKLTESEAVVS